MAAMATLTPAPPVPPRTARRRALPGRRRRHSQSCGLVRDLPQPFGPVLPLPANLDGLSGAVEATMFLVGEHDGKVGLEKPDLERLVQFCWVDEQCGSRIDDGVRVPRHLAMGQYYTTALPFDLFVAGLPTDDGQQDVALPSLVPHSLSLLHGFLLGLDIWVVVPCLKSKRPGDGRVSRAHGGRNT